MNLSSYILPIFIGLILIIGLIKKVDVFSEFIEGAKENLKVGVEIMPTLIALMTAIGMFKASGGLELITTTVAPIIHKLGFPAECVALALIRPISGSGGLAVFESILNDYGPDSFAGRVASVMMGSTETTFYTIAVYYSVTKVKKTRHTLLCSLSGDLTGFIFSALLVRLFFVI
ncbi:MAG: spore maturation protein [Clostridiales bacterium]|jgi:spore maturation protein B|nr:spore maturation protein [Clostridiales bacterium]